MYSVSKQLNGFGLPLPIDSILSLEYFCLLSISQHSCCHLMRFFVPGIILQCMNTSLHSIVDQLYRATKNGYIVVRFLPLVIDHNPGYES